MTPHTSAYTMECLQAMGEKMRARWEDVVQGILPQRAVQKKSVVTLVKKEEEHVN